MDTLVDTILGGYKLKRLLGSGGMGSVYLAEDDAIGQQVAIKVIRGEGDDSTNPNSMERAAERFRREARAIASLDHLHVLPLYRYGEEETINGRRAYMVMQYRPEGSLWDWLRHRAGNAQANTPLSGPGLPAGLPSNWPLPLAEATSYLTQAASALQYAHDRGIIHRDIKPANFLLRFDPGQANAPVNAFLLLSDFGLAKLYSTTSGTSQVFGTPIYMAPEQFAGEAGPACDQYALAVMIYYFLAGRPPFEGEPMQMMHSHLAAPPPSIRQFAPNLPPEIEGVLTRALAKKPEARYPSITHFANAFSQAARISGSSLLLSPGGQIKKAAFLPSLPATNTSAPNSQISNPHLYESPTVAAQAPSPYALQQGTSHPYMPPAPRVNRRNALSLVAGGALVLVAAATIGTGVYVLASQNTSAQNPPPGTGTNPSGTPTKVPPTATATSPMRTVLTGHNDAITSLSWSPNGALLVSGSLDATARLWSPASSQQATFTYQQHQQAVLDVAWNPANPNQIASSSKDETLQVWSTSGSRENEIDVGQVVNSFVWQSTSLLLGTNDGLFSARASSDKASRSTIRSSISSLAISPSKRYLATGDENGHISIYDLSNNKLRHVYSASSHEDTVKALAWSPNSAQLASASADQSVQILTFGTHQIRTLTHRGTVNGVAWDPASNGRLATVAADGHLHIWSAGSSDSLLAPRHQDDLTAIAWSTAGLVTGSSNGEIIVWNI